MKDDQSVRLTKTLIDEYRQSLLDRGYKQQTINMYLCYLNQLYTFLPPGKHLTDENLSQWVESLKLEGYSDRTINLHISAVNGLLKYCGHRNMPSSVITHPEDADSSELTRKEYLQLISYVKKKGSYRNYLLVETLATVDINVTDLFMLTVEACQKGVIEYSNQREVVIPNSLRKELLTYIEKKGLISGPVFITRGGQLIDRSNINHKIEQLGGEAGLDPKKCNLRSLHLLYRRTQEEIDKELMPQHMRIYEQMLEREQLEMNRQSEKDRV